MPIGIKAVRAALEAGDRIMVTLRGSDGQPAKQAFFYSLKSTGQTIPPSTVQKLKDDLEPMDKGLFYDAPQSFILKPGA